MRVKHAAAIATVIAALGFSSCGMLSQVCVLDVATEEQMSTTLFLRASPTADSRLWLSIQPRDDQPREVLLESVETFETGVHFSALSLAQGRRYVGVLVVRGDGKKFEYSVESESGKLVDAAMARDEVLRKVEQFDGISQQVLIGFEKRSLQQRDDALKMLGLAYQKRVPSCQGRWRR